MAFDLPTLIRFVIIPAALALLGFSLAIGVRRTSGRQLTDSTATESGDYVSWTSLIVSMTWALAAIAGILAADQFTWWPEANWARLSLPLLATAALSSPPVHHFVKSLVFGWITIIAAMLVMPAGEGWDDMLPLHRNWMAAIFIASTANAYSLQQMAERGGTRWLSWVIVANLGIAAIVGAASFSALFHACLAAVCATMVCGIIVASGRLPEGAAVIMPSMLFCAAMIAAGRFYSYAEVPVHAYAAALFAPTVVAIVDRLVSNQATWIRVGTAAIVSAVLVACAAYWFLIS